MVDLRRVERGIEIVGWRVEGQSIFRCVNMGRVL